MADSLLYITFKDTASSNDAAGQQMAIANIIAQLVAASERIQADPDSVYAYLRQDSNYVVKKAEPAQPAIPASAPAPSLAPILTEGELMDIVFKDIKRTKKSESIVRYFVQNSGTELTVAEIMAGSSMSQNDLSSWLAQTGKRIPAITNPSRGTYKFNPNNLKPNGNIPIQS